MRFIKRRENEIQLIGMIVISLIGQVVSLYKSVYTAAAFGASSEMDAYNFAVAIVSFFVAFVTTGITTVVLPAYVKNKKKESIDSFLSVIFVTLIVLFGIIYFFRQPVVRILANREQDFNSFFCENILKVLCIQGITTVLGVTTAYYQAKNRFIIPKLIILISNIIVLFLLIAMPTLNMEGYLNILLAGSAINVTADLFVAIKIGFRYKISFYLHDDEVKLLFRLFFPTLLSCGVYKIQTLVDSMLTTNLDVGMLTLLNYSLQIINIVNSFIVGNLVTYAYPKIVKSIDQKEGQQTLWNYVILFQAIIGLMIAGFIVVGKDAVSILYERGVFGPKDTEIVYMCSSIYICGQFIIVSRDLIYRFFYAAEDVVTTVKNSIWVSISNIILSVLLSKVLGIYGIVLGTCLAGCISFTMIMFRFKRKFEFISGMSSNVWEFLKNGMVTVLATVGALILKSIINIDNPLLCIAVNGVIVSGIYFCLAIGLKNRALRIRV